MSHIDVPVTGLSVMIGIPGGRNPSWDAAMALASTLLTCQRMGIVCTPGIVKGSAIVTKARDEVLHLFLESDADRLLWIDDDMLWTVDDFLRLLALSTRYDVIGASYAARKDPPTFYIKLNDENTIESDEHGMLKVEGMGLGFTMVRRHVIEELVATKPKMRDQLSGKQMASVFRTDIYNGNFRGEDMAFFADVRELGYDVYLDPAIQLQHVGTKHYTGSIMDALKVVPQPAEAACAVEGE